MSITGPLSTSLSPTPPAAPVVPPLPAPAPLLRLCSALYDCSFSEGPVLREQVMDLMGRLVDRSLVVVLHGDSAEPRYHFLETLREYAREKLTESSAAEQANWQY